MCVMVKSRSLYVRLRVRDPSSPINTGFVFPRGLTMGICIVDGNSAVENDSVLEVWQNKNE